MMETEMQGYSVLVEQEEFNELYKKHQDWLDGKKDGKQLNLHNVTLLNIDMNKVPGATEYKVATLYDVNLKSCRIAKSKGNLWFEKSTLHHCVFLNCDLDYLEFRDSSVGTCKIDIPNKLFNLRITWSLVSNTRFYCTLNHLHISDSRMNYNRFRGASFEDIHISQSYLQGNTGLESLNIGNMGTFRGEVIYLPEHDIVLAGCWSGTLEEFRIKGKQRNKNNYQQRRNIKIAYQFFKNNRRGMIL